MNTEAVIIDDDDTPPDIRDVAHLVEELAKLAADNADDPQPIAAGTFVLYPMPDGGMMFVTNVPDGPLQGMKHSRIAPGLIRAMGVLMGGGSKLSALKALTGRRKAIGGK